MEAMDAKGLMLGNFLFFNNSFFKVDCINEILERKIKSEVIKPIPITKDWLLDKFGFKENGEFKFDLGRFQIQNYRTQTAIQLDCFCYNDLKIKHVHQLQNLYFALTEKELTIK